MCEAINEIIKVHLAKKKEYAESQDKEALDYHSKAATASIGRFKLLQSSFNAAQVTHLVDEGDI